MRTNNNLSPHMTPGPGIEPRPPGSSKTKLKYQNQQCSYHNIKINRTPQDSTNLKHLNQIHNVRYHCFFGTAKVKQKRDACLFKP